MRSKFSLAAVILVLTVVLAACGGGNSANNTGGASVSPTPSPTVAPTDAPAESPEPTSITVTHQLGETEVPVNPSKVVVFDYGVLDTLDKLGVEAVASVPQAGVPSYLSKYEDSKYVNAGSLKEPDLETIHGISPDLIIISGRQSTFYEELKDIAPTIYMGVDAANYLESFTSNVTLLGQIFGKEAEAEAELATITDVIKSVNERATANGKNGLIILVNEGNISAYGAGSRFGIIHDVLGVTPVDANIEVSTHGQSVTFEYIAEKDPDYLFVVDRTAALSGEAGAKETVENKLMENTKSFKEGNIVYLDPEYWYLSGGGLVSVAKMVNDIDEAVN